MKKNYLLLQNTKPQGQRSSGLKLFFIGLITLLLFFNGIDNQILAQGVSINETGVAPDGSAALDVSSSSQGMLLPRLTTVERDAITTPVASLLIFNTTTQCFEAYYAEGSSWISFGCLGCTVPSGVTAAASLTTISVGTDLTLTGTATDAVSYNWTGPNGYSSSTQSPVITGIPLAGTGIYTLAASNNCGSVTDTIEVTVTFTCGDALPVNHLAAGSVAPVDKSVTYGTVTSSLSGASKCWITQNLGSTNQAGSVSDATEAAAGWYWEFNQKKGSKHDGTTRTGPAWVDIDEDFDWESTNDPCTIELGAGWRIPTSTEWGNAITNGSWSTSADAFVSDLKLHQAGNLDDLGNLNNSGSKGYFWSSTQENDGTDANDLYINGVGIYTQTPAKTNEFSVRCIKD